MFAHVIALTIGLVALAVRKAKQPLRAVASPSPARVLAMDGAYRRWAERHRLTLDESARAYRGRLENHETVVWPGLDGSTASSVQTEIAIDHGQSTPVLLTARSSGTTEIENALIDLFADDELARAVHSVAVTRRGVRMRFRALTPPETVEHGVVAVVGAIRHARARSGALPYR